MVGRLQPHRCSVALSTRWRAAPHHFCSIVRGTGNKHISIHKCFTIITTFSLSFSNLRQSCHTHTIFVPIIMVYDLRLINYWDAKSHTKKIKEKPAYSKLLLVARDRRGSCALMTRSITPAVLHNFQMTNRKWENQLDGSCIVI